MGIKLIGPGPSPKTGGWGGLAEAFAKGVENYQGARESADQKALKQLLVRAQLTGKIGTPTGRESRALRGMGITDPSTIHPTKFSQKLAEISSPETTAAITAMTNQQKQLMGIKVADPMEERKTYLGTLEAWNKNAKAMGLPDPVPPPPMRLEWEKHFGEPYPTQTVQDPTTGAPVSKPVPYTGAAEMTPEKIQARVLQMLNMAAKQVADGVLSKEGARGLIESQLQFRLGENWQEKHTAVAEMLDAAYAQYGWAPRSSDRANGPLDAGYQGAVPPSPTRPSPVKAFMEGLLEKMGDPRSWGPMAGPVGTVASMAASRPHAPTAPTAPGPTEGQTATNPKTGQRVVYRGGRWQSLPP